MAGQNNLSILSDNLSMQRRPDERGRSVESWAMRENFGRRMPTEAVMLKAVRDRLIANPSRGDSGANRPFNPCWRGESVTWQHVLPELITPGTAGKSRGRE